MGESAFKYNLEVLKTLYPDSIKDIPHRIQTGIIKTLPLWIKGAVEIFELPLVNTQPIYLFYPKVALPFENLMRIYQYLSTKLQAPVLIIADSLPAKHRPLLVKFNMAFIYKNESVFAPILGVKLGNFKKFKKQSSVDLKIKKERLSPFALKIIAGICTKDIDPKFTLNKLYKKIKDVSPAKLSLALNELASHGILTAVGGGRTREFLVPEISHVWAKVLKLPLTPFFKEVETNYIPKNENTFVIGGEVALSHYSNLAAPKLTTIAMSTKEFKQAIQSKSSAMKPYGDFGNPSIIQIWKENPFLFSRKGLLNPVELFFSMRNHHDERIQMALDEVLKDYNLNRGTE